MADYDLTILETPKSPHIHGNNQVIIMHVPVTSSHFRVSLPWSLISVCDQCLVLRMVLHVAWSPNTTRYINARSTYMHNMWPILTGNILHKHFFVLSRNQQITYEISLYDQFPLYVFCSLADVGTLSKSLRKNIDGKAMLSVLKLCIGLLMMSLRIHIYYSLQVASNYGAWQCS